MDCTCVSIGQQMCFYSAMKHGNDMTEMIICLQVVKSYSFTKGMKLYILVFLLVKSENNDFIKEIKQVLRGWLRLKLLLICSRILPNVRLSCHQAMKVWRKSTLICWEWTSDGLVSIQEELKTLICSTLWKLEISTSSIEPLEEKNIKFFILS